MARTDVPGLETRAPDGPVLSRSFYARSTEVVARDLLGKVLVVRDGSARLAATIVETEAYLGRDDPASHAYRGPTARATIMFGPPGHLYVYFSYGNHHCMNVVTDRDGQAGAVLIRAAEPVAGIALMARRRGLRDIIGLLNGPGKLAQALGIDRSCNGLDVTRGRITIRGSPPVPKSRIARSGRVGVREAADWPLRFAVKGSRFVSRPWPWAAREPRRK